MRGSLTRFLMRSPWTEYRRREHLRVAGALVWLAFILFPLGAAVARRAPVLHHVLTIAGAAVFVGAYIGLVFLWRDRRSVREGPSAFEVLLFVDQKLERADAKGTSVDSSRVVMTMVRQDGRWLVDEVDLR